MKTILVLTDFSIKADRATNYALKLALQTRCDLLLCNMFLVPYVEPMTTQLAWPVEDFQTIHEDSINDLKEVAERLNNQLDYEIPSGGFRPAIGQCSKSGSIAEIFDEIAGSNEILLTIISQHGTEGSSSFAFDDHARKIIEKAIFPVMIVPDFEPYHNFQKIAFATDLSITDIDILQNVTSLAKLFGAEVLVTHIADENSDEVYEERIATSFFKMAAAEINYPIINQTIKSKSIVSGLDWITENAGVDLLVLVHRKRNFFYRLVEGSVTHKMTEHLNKPLLIMPVTKVPDRRTV